MITELPGTNSYFWKQGRRMTYNNWPFKQSDKCNAESMAAAGFYVVGDSNEPDLVECFICGKQLDGWEPNDDPWSEHKKHQSSCPFVKLNKQDEKNWTISELYDLYKKYQTKEYMNRIKQDIGMLKDVMEQLIGELSVHKMSQKNQKSTN
ncbi:baculoviral IAP repeat-containing protein 5 [Monomorium pharaonis]|uniref:baculoviral IAP repeat-containing protein 5 n=1 Tax=Monomorium pharaonis TaxID=307658 RepID=UPI00063F2036|nr:baculoviral IAP repeat-containing protein 5 [Monomorium pharaonis]